VRDACSTWPVSSSGISVAPFEALDAARRWGASHDVDEGSQDCVTRGDNLLAKVLVRIMLAVLVGAAAFAMPLAGACRSPTEAASPSAPSVARAFAAAHPDGQLWPGLTPAMGVPLKPQQLRRASGLS